MEFKLNVTYGHGGYNKSGEALAFNDMKLDEHNKYIKGSDDATWKAIIALPRLETYNGGNTVRVKIQDKVYVLSNKFFTEEEHKIHKDYRSEHKGNGGSKPKGDQEIYDLLIATAAQLPDGDLKNQVLVRAEAIKPVDPKLAKLFALMKDLTDEQKAQVMAAVK